MYSEQNEASQPKALRIAANLEYDHEIQDSGHSLLEGASELRRLFELAQEQHTEIYGLRLEVRRLHSVSVELLHWMKYIQAQTHLGHIHDTASSAIAKAQE